MDKLTSFIGKRIVSVDEAEQVGYIINVQFDTGIKRALGFVVVDEESEIEKFLPNSAVKKVTDDYVVISSSAALTMLVGEVFSPLGKLLFDRRCQPLGRICDAGIESRAITMLVTDTCEVKAGVYHTGKDCIFLGMRQKKPQMPKVKQPEILPKVVIMSKNKPKSVSVPHHATVNVSMLLSRIATADIFGLNHEIIIRKGEVITASKIERAKKHGRINLLMYYSE